MDDQGGPKPLAWLLYVCKEFYVVQGFEVVKKRVGSGNPTKNRRTNAVQMLHLCIYAKFA